MAISWSMQGTFDKLRLFEIAALLPKWVVARDDTLALFPLVFWGDIPYLNPAMVKKRWPFYIFLTVVIFLLAIAGGCIKRRDAQRTREMRGRSVEQAFDSHRDRLLSVPGVVGAGIARLDDRPSIVVMIRERTPGLTAQIPAELDGYPVVIEIIGDPGAQGDSL